MKDSWGDWFSASFFSHASGYRIKLNLETKQRADFMKVRLYRESSKHHDKLDWPVTFGAAEPAG